jgi:HAMP domain-containing protein
MWNPDSAHSARQTRLPGGEAPPDELPLGQERDWRAAEWNDSSRPPFPRPANPPSQMPAAPSWGSSGSMGLRNSPTSALFRLVQGDPLLKWALACSLVILAYQVTVLLLRPAWLPAATDWLRAGLGLLACLPLGLAAYVLLRERKPGKASWLMFTGAMLSYTLAQHLRATVDFPTPSKTIPFPYYPDIFYLLQYPFFFAAFALFPGVKRRGEAPIAHIKLLLDSLLLMAAGTALSWYFFLAPAYTASGESALGKATSLAYPVGDLGLLFGLVVALSRQRQSSFERITLRVLIAAVVFLIGADTWYAYAQSYLLYTSGDLPDLLWIVSYVLFGFAGLVQYRLVPRQTRQRTEGISGALLLTRGKFSLFFPFVAAVLASIIIVLRATTAPIGNGGLAIPFAVSFGLIVLVAARQGVTVLENEHLLRAESQRAEELAVASHIAEEQRQLMAERNQRLGQDIEALKEVHARVARGDYSARVPITSGELLPIAGSFNLMLERLAMLVREHASHDKLDHAAHLVSEAAQGLAAGDDRALARLTVPTNTLLDAVAIALGQLRTRIKELNTGLLQLEQARRASRELADIAAQQGQFITNEGTALNGIAGTLGRLASELEGVIQTLEQVPNSSSPLNRSLVQTITILQALARSARQQISEIDAQVVRFAQAEERANLAAIGGRRLAVELDAAARTGGSRVTLGVPGMAQALGTVPPPPPGNLARAVTKPFYADPRTSGPFPSSPPPQEPARPLFPWEQAAPPRTPGPAAPGQPQDKRNGKLGT